MYGKRGVHMFYYFTFIVLGYFMGSFLFAPFFGYLLKHKDIICDTKDKNPGTANAFMQGGLICGIMTLIGDIAKGFLPVFLCLNMKDTIIGRMLWQWNLSSHVENSSTPLTMGLALVLLAPVLGHMFPIYYKFQGGKGIAVTFGSLLGFAPNLLPALTLALFFILFSLVIRITPHFYRTIGTYLFTSFVFLIWGQTWGLKLGFLLITVMLCIRMHMSTENREQCKVSILWMH